MKEHCRMISMIPNVFAGGARMDWSDPYDNVPDATDCQIDGYDDGQNGPFDQERHEEYIVNMTRDVSRFNQPYYEAFIHGCIHAGNT
jgi:hypothetical protein